MWHNVNIIQRRISKIIYECTFKGTPVSIKHDVIDLYWQEKTCMTYYSM